VAQQSNEAVDETAKQCGTDHRTLESRTQNATQLAQRPPGRHHGSGAGRERFQFEEDLESPGSFSAQNIRADYGVVG